MRRTGDGPLAKRHRSTLRVRLARHPLRSRRAYGFAPRPQSSALGRTMGRGCSTACKGRVYPSRCRPATFIRATARCAFNVFAHFQTAAGHCAERSVKPETATRCVPATHAFERCPERELLLHSDGRGGGIRTPDPLLPKNRTESWARLPLLTYPLRLNILG